MSFLQQNDNKNSSQLATLKVLFPDWTEEDLLFTLQDTDGDLDLAIDLISEGHARQWDQVKTKKSKKETMSVNKVGPAEPVPVTTPPHPSKHKTIRSTSSYRPVKKPSWQAYASPKKPSSTPSTRSNQTWASLLQTKPEAESKPAPESEREPFQTVDASWLFSKQNDIPFEPLQVNKKSMVKHEPSLLPPPSTSFNFGAFNSSLFFQPQPSYNNTLYPSYYYPQLQQQQQQQQQQQTSAYAHSLYSNDLFQPYKF